MTQTFTHGLADMSPRLKSHGTMVAFATVMVVCGISAVLEGLVQTGALRFPLSQTIPEITMLIMVGVVLAHALRDRNRRCHCAIVWMVWAAAVFNLILGLRLLPAVNQWIEGTGVSHFHTMSLESAVCLILLTRMTEDTPHRLAAFNLQVAIFWLFLSLGIIRSLLFRDLGFPGWEGDGVSLLSGLGLAALFVTRFPLKRLRDMTGAIWTEMGVAFGLYLAINWGALALQSATPQGAIFAVIGIVIYLFSVRHMITVSNERNRFLEVLANKSALIARQADQLRSVTRSLSHDIRAPIRNTRTCLDMWDDMVASGAYDDDDIRRMMRSNLDRAFRLSVRSVEYLAGGSADLGGGRTDLSEVFDDLTRNFLGQVLVLWTVDGPLSLQGEPDLYERLFTNLVSNVLEHNPKTTGLSVYIEATASDNVALISIEDNGIGIPEKYRDRIFRPFETLEAKAGTVNSGLGLSICRQLLEQVDGSIHAAEPRTLTGARFEIVVPVAGVSP